ncbi:MAG TPA: SCO1664 family protein [Acidimicrobiales bacterium]
MPKDERASPPGPLSLLTGGEIELQGRLPWSSNRTFLVSCSDDGRDLLAVYKPHRGERPLWDFPGGLYRREVAAYELSGALGWDVVPETVIRTEAPLGVGSLQRFVAAEFTEHYFTLVEDPSHLDALKVIATFDLLLNNADRKSGHCLLGLDGRIWAIDNGLSFHPEPKLRTVMWDFSGEPVPDNLVADIDRVARDLPMGLDSLLGPEELEGIQRRATAVVASPQFPAPAPERRPYPWPLV